MPKPPKIPGRKRGRKGELRPHGVKRILTQEQKDNLAKNLKPGNNEFVIAAKKERDETYQTMMQEFQTCDAVTFATKFLRQDFEGFPFQKLVLCCANGLPLPDGKLKTFVEIEGSTGFAVKEVEMTWDEFFIRCSGGKKYKQGNIPQIVVLRIGRRGGK